MNIAFAVFDDEKLAARAVDALVEHDFTMADICVLLRKTAAFGSDALGEQVNLGGAGTREGLGARVTAAGGTLRAIGSSDLLAAGPLSGMAERAAPVPHDRLTQGAVLVGVLTEDSEQLDSARGILEDVGAPEVQVHAALELLEEVERVDRAEADKRIDEALVESFPASDPPSGWSGPPRPPPDKR